MGKFGHSIKEYFVQNTPIEEYTKALLDLIQYTYFIEEWLKCVLKLKRDKAFKQNDKIALEYLKNVSRFLQDVIMVIVLNDLKYMLSYYLVGMQNALVEDNTLTQMAIMKNKRN